ncbi:CLUMA_CG016101, isoform A [Clunio marinus]|uniref:CLUMA_CG016101, isoform A n=1 Tax=Clunio marinus TaxID=568069 RepID=A0A1J1IW00_9DIPT|nr:CLUMA_CG016101, isoform A [Clunio marinus]
MQPGICLRGLHKKREECFRKQDNYLLAFLCVSSANDWKTLNDYLPQQSKHLQNRISIQLHICCEQSDL